MQSSSPVRPAGREVNWPGASVADAGCEGRRGAGASPRRFAARDRRVPGDVARPTHPGCKPGGTAGSGVEPRVQTRVPRPENHNADTAHRVVPSSFPPKRQAHRTCRRFPSRSLKPRSKARRPPSPISRRQTQSPPWSARRRRQNTARPTVSIRSNTASWVPRGMMSLDNGASVNSWSSKKASAADRSSIRAQSSSTWLRPSRCPAS